MPTIRDDEPRRRRKHTEHDGDRNRDRDRDRDPESTSSREKHRSSHKSKSSSSSKLPLHTTSSKSSSKEKLSRARDLPRPATSGGRPSEQSPSRKVSVIVPEMDRRPSGEVRPPVSYPTFSKAHSREAVGSREDIATGKTSSPYTPDATEIGREGKRRRNSTPAQPTGAARPPPSPPLTAEEPDIGRSGSSRGMRDVVEDRKHGNESERPSIDSEMRRSEVKDVNPTTNLRKEARFGDSELSSMPGSFPDDENKSTPNSSYRRTASTTSQTSKNNSTLTDDTNTDSDATSIAPDRKGARRVQLPRIIPINEPSPPFDDSRPQTPTQEHVFSPHTRATPVIDVSVANKNTIPSHTTPLTARYIPPVPPPPPPPPSEPKEAPRVDYLLKNGGLPYQVSKRLVAAGPVLPQQYNLYQSPALNQAAPIEEYAKVFSQIHKRLDDYLSVIEKNGSLAVATGYKSVARRLLDKLSQVFARDISSERCDCVVCKTTPQPPLSDEEDSGVSWGEILEFVAGRRELPQWPPFSIQPDDSGSSIPGQTQAPMQKLDIDVPEEYRDHYIRQNQKTKRAVQNWLAQQPDFPSSPPEEADEDTLMFAMMTKLTSRQRNLFLALMHGQNFISEARAPTPAERPATSSNALRRARKALHRLYRLERPPRDCESAMYLLSNPHLHGMLATLAEVNEAEWDILISGRFDGFLWSGAEAPLPPTASGYASPLASRGPSRGPNMTPFSRNTTPFSGLSSMQSRNTTPFSPLRNPMSPEPIQIPPPPTPSMFPARGQTPGVIGVAAPAPVQLDEDTEIAVAAELERNLFLDMERLEDAFEILHGRAELVRQMLRERSAGLSAQAQLRRGSNGFPLDPIGVRLDTPASAMTDFEDEEDDGLGDVASLAPDDSASQISVNRRHRPRRERKTPLPDVLAEEDESVFEEDGGRSHRRERVHERTNERSGRRSKY